MANGRTRYLFLGGLDRERINKCIAKLDMELQEKFQNKVVELTKKAHKIRITTPAGIREYIQSNPLVENIKFEEFYKDGSYKSDPYKNNKEEADKFAMK